MRNFNKLRWLLLIPIFGFMFFSIYVEKEDRKYRKITGKQKILYMFSCAFTFLLAAIAFTVLLAWMDSIIHISENIIDYLIYWDRLLSIYAVNIPCYIYCKKVNKIFLQAEQDDSINTEMLCVGKNNNQVNAENFAEKAEQDLKDNKINQKELGESDNNQKGDL